MSESTTTLTQEILCIVNVHNPTPHSPKQYSLPITSPLVGEVSLYYWIHPQLTLNHISKTSTMFWGYNDTSSQIENYINTFAST